MMEVTHYIILAYLLLITQLAHTCFGNPIPQTDENDNYNVPYGDPLTKNRLSTLRRGYYFVDDGFITAVLASAVVPKSRSTVGAAARRQYDDSKDTNYFYYKPVVSYRHAHTKHKKLFVPNLFG